jgi:hypothetical protein
MKIIEISANNNMSYYVNASEIEAVEISQGVENIVEYMDEGEPAIYKYNAVVFLKSGKIIFDNELFPDKKEIFRKYFQGE